MQNRPLSPKQQARQQAQYQHYLEKERARLEQREYGKLRFGRLLGQLTALLVIYLMFSIGWKPANNLIESFQRSGDINYVTDD